MEVHEVPEKMEIHFDADDLDLLNVGVLAYHLHAVLNQVAITMFQASDDERRIKGEPQLLTYIPQSYNREDRLVSARITALRQGSLEMELAGFITAVFSQSGAVAVVHNLFSSAIWAIGTYAAKLPGIRVNWNVDGLEAVDTEFLRPVAGRKRLKPRIDRFIELLAESSNGGKLRLRSGTVDLEIEFYGKKKETEG